AWCLMRAPLGSALGLASLFSSALFYRPMLGMFSASAGSLVVLGLVLLLAAALRWRGGVARRWWSLSAAAVLVLAAPYVVRYFGRGIAPPAGGVSFGLWISWQLAVAAASMALVVWAAALVRGTAEPRGVPWTLPAACAWAVLAALAGLWLWQPSGARPWWVCWCRHRVAGRCAASPPLPARPPRSSPGARRSKVVSVSPSVTPRGWVARTTRLRLRCSSAWVTSCQCPRRARQESCTHSGSSRLSPARTIPRVSRPGHAPATPWPSSVWRGST